MFDMVLNFMKILHSYFLYIVILDFTQQLFVIKPKNMIKLQCMSPTKLLPNIFICFRYNFNIIFCGAHFHILYFKIFNKFFVHYFIVYNIMFVI